MSTLASPQYRRPGRSGESGAGAQRSELSRTLEDVRARLAERQPMSERLERELVLLHAQTVRTSAPLILVPVLLAGLMVTLFVTPLAAALFVAAAGGATLASILLLRRLARADPLTIQPERWTALVLVPHVAAGLAWSTLALLDCTSCASPSFEIALLAVLVPAIAITALVASTIRNVVLFAFAPLLAALAGRAAEASDPSASAVLLVPAAAVPLFAVTAARLRRSAIERFRLKSEKDDLIAALEEERIAADEARMRAEEANSAKSRFLATMSHELRTPLNAILGFSEVITNEILGPVGNPTYREYVGDIHASGRHLLDLINEILDLSRVEAGRYALNEEAVDLAAIVADGCSFLSIKADGRAIVLDVKAEEGLPLLWGDRRALRQVVLNLLSNAVKFAPEGSRIAVKVGWTAGGGQYFSIRDRGPGIPEGEMTTVLSSFGQGSNAIRSAEQGTGLGLPIVQALVHLHDGEFRLDSPEGGGTEAVAIFPHPRVLKVMPAALDYV